MPPYKIILDKKNTPQINGGLLVLLIDFI